MSITLAEAIAPERIGFEELRRRYRPVLALVDVLIGVVPNCDRYLEIWPPGFRTYNLVVPNFLDLPASLLGRGAPRDVVGLAMYASSRAAGCAYCSAHTCSFALRRGSTPAAVVGEHRTPLQQAAVDVAEALSRLPHRYRPELGERLVALAGPAHAEWIVMGVAMMGFLNKFMDALGVELEPESVGDVAALLEPTGWAVGQHGWAGGLERDRRPGAQQVPPPRDSAATLARVFRHAPGAVRLDRRWSAGVPREPAAARRFVQQRYGFDEPLLTTMGAARPRRALAAVLRHNLDPAQSVLGIPVKALAGLVFAEAAASPQLTRDLTALAHHSGAAAAPGGVPVMALELAHALAPSPAAVDPALVARAREVLSAPQIVELAVWLSVCQLIHRLSVWYGL